MINQIMPSKDGHEFGATITRLGQLHIKRCNGYYPLDSIEMPLDVAQQLYEFLAREFGPQSFDEAREALHRIFPGSAA